MFTANNLIYISYFKQVSQPMNQSFIIAIENEIKMKASNPSWNILQDKPQIQFYRCFQCCSLCHFSLSDATIKFPIDILSVNYKVSSDISNKMSTVLYSYQQRQWQKCFVWEEGEKCRIFSRKNLMNKDLWFVELLKGQLMLNRTMGQNVVTVI